jgi:hypothetical protein
MSERAEADPTNDDERPPEETVNQYLASNRPGMIAVRRRKGRRRHRTAAVDVRFRTIRLFLLGVVILLLIYQATPDSAREEVLRAGRQIVHPLHHLFAPKLEIVALLIAAAILIYLTPGVEDFVLRFLGIKRKTAGRR